LENTLLAVRAGCLCTARSSDFWVGGRQIGYGGTEPREAMSFLSDDNGMVLALFRVARGAEVKYPTGFHVGFIQESEDRVNEINQRLREDGYEVPKPARLHGSWTFYFNAPGGFMVEVLG